MTTTSDRLSGRVVVVTGAGRGLGRAHATYVAGQGARVVVNDLGTDVTGDGTSTATAQAVVEEILAAGGEAVADSHDVADDGAGLIETAMGAFGRIDGLVNNAGIFISGGIDELTGDQFTRMFGVHVWGTLNTVRAAWPIMRRQGYGRIVNTTSCSLFGVAGSAPYLTSKGAIVGLTKALAADGAAHGIKVNAIMPMGYSRMADTQAGLADFMKQNFPPERVSPFLGSLLVPETPTTGEVFAVAGGRAARVFLATVPGLVGFTTIDDCLTGFERVMDLEGFVAPTSMDEEIGFEYAQLGVDLAALGIDLTELGTTASRESR